MKGNKIYSDLRNRGVGEKIVFHNKVLKIQAVYIKCLVGADSDGKFHEVTAENFACGEVYEYVEPQLFTLLIPTSGIFSHAKNRQNGN